MDDRNRPDMVKIFVPIEDLSGVLRDRRPRNFGCFFGKVETILNQYGIKKKKVKGGHIFYAPKVRMQMFVEKLHFAVVPFREVK